MTIAPLRVSRRPPIASRAGWFGLIDMPGGAWTGSGNVNNAVYYNGHTYIGYIDANASIRVASYDHAAQTVAISPAIATITSTQASPGVPVDLHTAPAVLLRSSDHKILVAYTPQGTNHMYVALSTNAEDVSAWGAPTDIAATLAGGGQYSYAHLTQLSGESGKIYLLYRDGLVGATGKLCQSVSTDGGATWTAQTVIYQATNAYWSIDSDDASRVDFAVTDGTAASGDTASLYHFYYTAGSYYKTDGTLITAALPLGPSSLTKIYDGATNGSVRVPFAIRAASGPYILLAAANTAGYATNPENYWYGVYTGGSWSVHEITDSGAIPTADLAEGGLALDAVDPTHVYVSRTPASGVYTLYLYETPDSGATWTSTQLTNDTDQPNWHPTVPHNANSGVRCLWSYGPIAPDNSPQNFACQIRGYPNPIAPF